MHHLSSEWITISDKDQDTNTSENFMADACITDKRRLLAILDKFEKSIVEYNHVEPKRVYMMSDDGEFASANNLRV